MQIAVRLTGALCIMAACILTGQNLERRLRKRWNFLREMQELLVFLDKEMTYHRAPVPEAFRCAAEKCATELGSVLLRAAQQIELRDGRPFARLWEEALARELPAGLLTDAQADTVRETALALCNTDTVMQRALLEKYADRFRTMSRDEEEICREKGGLYRKLAAAAGIFLVIILM